MLKVGIIGMGGISKCHVDGWLDIPEVKVTAICDIRSEQLIAPREKTKAECYTSFDEMLQNETLDILDICLPTFLHAEYAVKALEHGLHVLLEKPVSLELKDVDRISCAAKHYHKKVMVAQVLRFWKEYGIVKEIYQSQKYGKLLSGFMSRLSAMPGWSWDGWMKDEKKSGLVPFDLHIHDLDFIASAFGVPDTYQSYRAKSGHQDYLNVVYQFGGFFITCEASWFVGEYNFKSSYRFQFEKAIVELTGGVLTVYPEGEEKFTIENGDNEKKLGINLPSTGAYYNEIRYFTDCVIKGEEPDRVPMEELKEVLKILKNI